jgi:hypothetical protein
MHVSVALDAEQIRELAVLEGQDGRNATIEKAVRQRLEQDRRRRKMEAAIGSISEQGHIWDPDVAAWVHGSRGEDPGSAG